MSRFCPKCTGLVPSGNMSTCPNCGADLSNVTEDVLDEGTQVNNQEMQQQMPNPMLNFANSNIFKESGNTAKDDRIDLNNTMMMSNVNVAMLNNEIGNYQNNNDMNSNQMMQNNQMIQNNQMMNGMPMSNDMMQNNQMMMNNGMPMSNDMMQNNQMMMNNGMPMSNGMMQNNQMMMNNGMMPEQQMQDMNTTGSKVGLKEKLSFIMKKHPKILMLAGGGLAALIIIIIAIVMISSGPSAVAKKYLKGVETYNADKILSTMHPKVAKENKESLKSSMYEAKAAAKENNVKTKIKLQKDYTILRSNELESAKAMLNRLYEINESSIKEIREYKAEVTIKSQDDEQSFTNTIRLVKIGSKWYVV